MTDLTPERLQDAAETMRLLAIRYGWHQDARRSPDELRQYADKLEAEQAEEVKRAIRIIEFGDELIAMARPDIHFFPSLDECSRIRRIAESLLDRYPDLFDE